MNSDVEMQVIALTKYFKKAPMKFVTVAIIACALNPLVIYGRDLDGTTPDGIRVGLSVLRFDAGHEFVFGGNNVVLTPALALSYLFPIGIGIDLSGAFVLQDGTFERFFGGTTNAGLLYRIPNTVMLLKAGWSYFGGGDSDGGNLDTTGPYLGFATMLRIAGHLGIRVDLSGHHFERRGSVPDRVLGLKFSVGLTFLPKLSN